MKKLFLLAWLMMLSIVATAQTIIVVDKDGNRVPFDPTKVTSVDFQKTPPGFVINMNGKTVNYSYDVVKSLQGNPNHVFVDPETVSVNGESEDLAVQVKASVEFDVATSDPWITFDADAKDGQRYVRVKMNPSVDARTGTVTLTSKDGTLTSKLQVVQAGKEDGRYIAVDWEKDKLESYDPETGEAKITFAEDVPIMGEYDVFLLPQGDGTSIRVIKELTKTEGKTVTLSTEKGELGNLFKDISFSLEFGEGSSSNVSGGTASARGSKPVYRPVKIAEFDGEKYVEVYNANKASSRPNRAPQQLISRFDGSGTVIWEQAGVGSMTLDSYKSFLGLWGNVDFEFGKNPFGKVWMGKILKGGAKIHGNTEVEIVPHFKFESEQQMTELSLANVLKKDAIKRKYTFVIQGIDVDVYFQADLKCDYWFEAQGSFDITSGHNKSATVKYGVNMTNPIEWINDETDPEAELLNKKMSFADKYANSNLELSVWAYPDIRVSIYGEDYGQTRIHPKEKVHINAVSTPIDVAGTQYRNRKVMQQCATDVNYELYGFVDFYSRKNSTEGEPTTLALIPQQLEMVSDKEIWLMENDEQDVKFRVTYKDWNTGDVYASTGALLMFQLASDDTPLEFPKAPAGSDKKKFYGYADENGIVTATVKLLPTENKAALYDATFVDPHPGVEGMERGVVRVLRHDLQCLTPEQEIDENTESVPVTFELKRIKDTVEPLADQMVEFTVTGGTVEPLKEKTNAEGRVTVTFKPDKDATEGSVKALTYVHGNVRDWIGTANAKITIKRNRPSKEQADPKIRVWDSGEGGSKPQVIDDKGNGEVVFVVEERIKGEDADRPVEGAKVEFETDNLDDNLEGFSWATTDKSGKAPATFKVKNFAKFKGVKIKVKATVKYSDGEKVVETTAKVNSDGTLDTGGSSIDDESLKKADELKDNTYVVNNKKTGQTETLNYSPKYSEWSKGKDGVTVMLEDADADGGTQGMVNAFLPLTIIDVVTNLTNQTFENTPGIKLFFEKYQNGQVWAEFMKFTGEEASGNIKPDGNSKILLRKRLNPAPARNVTRGDGDDEEYTGEYELLFYLVFQNQTWNSETHQMELGDEYEVYGKGTMKMHIPTITSMQLSSEAQYLKVGESTKVKVDGYYEEGAQWDWNDVQISGQSADYSAAYDGVNEGYFTWDSATQTLTSVKPNDNKPVYVIFSLKSRPSCQSAMTIATGEGWKYTSFKVGPEEQEVSPGYYCSYYVEDWAPRAGEDERFDDSAIEIDPASDPDGNFRYVHYYGQYSARLYVYRSDAAPGEYNIRFRLKSNHDVNCTMKITIKPEE